MILYEDGEKSPLQNHISFSEMFNGNWDGEEMKFDWELGSLEFVGYEYQPGFFVGISKYKLDVPTKWVRTPSFDDNYITLRIGYFGDINSKGTNFSEGIQMYNAAQKYSFNSPQNEPLYFMIIRFPYSVYKEFNARPNYDTVFRNIFEIEDPWYYYYPMYPEIECLVKDAFEVRGNRNMRRTIFLTKALEIVAHLGVKLGNKAHDIVSKVHPDDIERMSDIKEKILRDYTVLPNLEELSASVGMSVSKLQRTFKSVFNSPLLKFFNLHRLEEAHRRIQYSHASLSEISYDLGFSNLSHLSSAFKKHFGYAPSEMK